MSLNIMQLIKIPTDEEAVFDKFIKKKRNSLIASSGITVRHIIKNSNLPLNMVDKNGVVFDISSLIVKLREDAYNHFLIEEAHFNTVVIQDITKKLDTPRQIVEKLIENKITFIEDESTLKEHILDICGDYAGHITPYIYKLCLSNTQSRRTRAGKTFEAIIYALYETFNYQYESQSTIGNKSFHEKNLGKVVDSILPSINAFEQRRDQVIIGTMKTTLRERWQEVVEELNRTNLPSIYLLTVDSSIPEATIEKMSQHNIILVVLDSVKQQPYLINKKNVISFEEYFSNEIPDKLSKWGL